MNASSKSELNDSRYLYYDVKLAAPPSEVWQRWSGSEGIRSFLGIDSHIDFRVGGAFEFYFNPDSTSTERGSEGCVILAIEKEKMLTFTWNAPPHMPDIRAQRTVVVLRMGGLPDGGTHLEISHYGWGESENWQQARSYFTNAWPNVLAALQKSFEQD